MTVNEDYEARQVDPMKALDDFHRNRSCFEGTETGEFYGEVIAAWNDWQMLQQIMELEERDAL